MWPFKKKKDDAEVQSFPHLMVYGYQPVKVYISQATLKEMFVIPETRTIEDLMRHFVEHPESLARTTGVYIESATYWVEIED